MATATETVAIDAGDVTLTGDLVLPEAAPGVVCFAHGSGSSRHSPRNRQVALTLQRAGLGTLLIDLLSEEEERVDRVTAELRFDIPLLGRRVTAAVDRLAERPDTGSLPVGLFGASTGAAAALVAAAARADRVSAVVSRGGRPDLAGTALGRVRAPVLLIVGGEDRVVLDLNEEAAEQLTAEYRVHVIPGATHLFEEPGTLEAAADAARDWFLRMGGAGGR
ncbi:dienelactone hydrolase family protein [Streptomyces pristinaespiralis]|jgi:putative phosphoribosyl transferase|uniref:Dienelactone hydrolase n=2 Tax=Streptomyces pristinaespiralis TaxID=38300 RepID=B5HCU5_STRE2|nr:dienelactone hydrolase family protein [Streptomyces pristinaespiralis]ALC24683.1 DeoR family transcriptional regulator [Streptomyces pristinaespiralis]EDY64668.1 dienelactone hydrolase [Streptomyces pristinaespiralis ATCC 25486]QMU12989.1 dienelactone hydrolase family protein [Streptomyces pristinaespiralis]